MRIIITGATGMVGEGVLLDCLDNPEVHAILVVGRRRVGIKHPKLQELLIGDFLKIDQQAASLQGYDACFFCAGISSVGMKEDQYTKITYDTTIHFAKVMLEQNPQSVFTYVSGAHTDSSEKGRLMWARVKGKTENDLAKLGFKGEYNFRPGFMKPVKGQKNVKWFFWPFVWIFPTILPKQSLTLEQVAKAMINCVKKGYPKNILEISDIREQAKR